MKFMDVKGKYCDLACYPSCQGYRQEGCIMFNEERSFLTVQLGLIANGVYVRELTASPQGMWKNHVQIHMAPNMKYPVFVGEPMH